MSVVNLSAAHIDNSIVIPWGRLAPVRKDIREAGLGISEGGTGNGENFWVWSVNELRAHGAE
jgi:hypothetical protein